MGKLYFEAITPAAALAYDPAVDSLGFFTAGVRVSDLSGAFGADGTFSLTFDGATVVFGPRFRGNAHMDLGGGLFIGSASGEALTGGSGGFAAFGGGGDDTLTSGVGADLLDGGAGVDTVTFVSTVTAGAVADLASGGAFISNLPSAVDTLRGVENITGTAFDDMLLGDGGGNVLLGLGGADTLNGRSGTDTLDGGGGGDVLDGGDGADLLTVGLGDTVTGGAGADTFQMAASASPITGEVQAVARIMDFTAEDRLDFQGGPAGTSANFAAISAGSYGEALVRAHALFAPGGVQYVAARVAGETFVFSPGTQQAVHLVSGAAAVTFSQIGASASGSVSAPTAGADTLTGGAGPDTISGGAGADVIQGGEGASYLRGDDGDDSIAGGGAFDDINGNAGNDTVMTGAGDDYCVGGKDNDSLDGGAGADLVYGNLGDDTCEGGDGDDVVRGGQGADVVRGGAGADFLSGDKGDDTLTGGGGSDIFHTFGDAGIDRVTDFSLADGDRVQLDPGTQYTLAQVGADTVISMTGGGQMILAGVQMSTLQGDWIFGA